MGRWRPPLRGVAPCEQFHHEASTYRRSWKVENISSPPDYKMESQGYCVRLDLFEGTLEKISAFIYREDWPQYLAVRHNGDKDCPNPHVHLVIRSSEEVKTFRDRLRKTFTTKSHKGNKVYTCVQWDGREDALSYLFHEEGTGEPGSFTPAEVISSKGLTADDIDRYRTVSHKIQALVKDSKAKASWRLEDDAMEHFKRLPQDPYHPFDERQIAEYIIRTALVSNKYMPTDWLLKSMVTRVQFNMCNGDPGKENVCIQNILGRLYKHNG